MEKGIDFSEAMEQTFVLPFRPLESYSPLALAFIGDSIYDVMIKSIVLAQGNRQVQKLHLATRAYVQAAAQSEMMRVIQEVLTPEETAIYKRGRNAKSLSAAKNASITDYRRATGFEALLGYLYMKKDYGRMTELVKLGMEAIEEHLTESVE